MIKAWLEWPFETQDYFQSPLEIMIDERKVVIENNKITLELNKDDLEKDDLASPQFLEKMDVRIHSVVNLLQIKSERKFNLKKYSLYSTLKEGNLNVNVFPDPIIIKITSSEPDLIMADNKGNEIVNTKKFVFEDLLNVLSLYSLNGLNDDTFNLILESYNRSLSDSKFSLLALYEIRDALTIRFKKESNARSVLKISKKIWQRMGEIANELPLAQSRHVGKKVSKPLRNITDEELKEIRSIAKKMIDSYLLYLNRTNI